jgi:head-tail adaptor
VIGSMRRKIELLTLSRIDDDGGGAAIVWLPGVDLWARVERLTSTRDVAGDRTSRLKRIAATIRSRTDIVLGQQIRFDDDAYEVVSIESEDDRDRRLTLICEEVII